MNTISDFLKILKTDKELIDLISNSEVLKRDYRPRTRKGRAKVVSTKSSIATKYFWESPDGAKFRYLLEIKYGVNIANVKIISAIKDALVLYLSEVMDQCEKKPSKNI